MGEHQRRKVTRGFEILALSGDDMLLGNHTIVMIRVL